MLTLVGELTLLALGEQSGTVVNSETARRLPYALAGAMLMDLVLAGHVALDGAVVVVRDRSPLPCPVLSATLATAPMSLMQTQWVRRRAEMRDGHRIYPERDSHAETEARGRILACVRGQAPLDFRTCVMVCLVHTAALVPTLFPPGEQIPTAGRVRAIAASVPVAGSVTQAEQAAGITEPSVLSGIPGGAIAAGAVGVAAVGIAVGAAAGITPEQIAQRIQRVAQDTGADVAVDAIGDVVEVAASAVDVGAMVGGVFEIIGGIFSLFDS